MIKRITVSRVLREIEWELKRVSFYEKETDIIKQVHRLIDGKSSTNHTEEKNGYSQINIAFLNEKRLTWSERNDYKHMLDNCEKYSMIDVVEIRQTLLKGYLIKFMILAEVKKEEVEK